MLDSPASATPDFLAGSGNVRQYLRTMDWSQSPLGPPAAWPAALRNAVALCLDTASSVAVYWGPQYCLLYNDAFAPFLADRHPAMLGQPASVTWPEIWPSLKEQFNAVVATGKGLYLERQALSLLRFGQPQTTWWTYSISPLRGENGAVAGLLSIAIESTDLIAAERRLIESQAYLRLMLDNSVNGLYGVDRNGAATLCNAVFLRMLGFGSEQEILGRDLHGLIHHSRPDGTHYPRAECPIFRGGRTGEPAHVENELFFRTDGTSFPVEYWVRPILRDGELQGAVCTFIDITERRLAAEALRESENRFRLIADSAPVPMWVTRLDRKRAFVNRAYVDFLGISYEEAVDYDWRHVIHPDDVKRIYAEQVANENALIPFTLEARYRNAAGEYRWLRSESQPRWDANGQHVGFIGAAYDITTAKRAAIELEAINITLEARVEARTRERDQAWKYSQDLQAVLNMNGIILAANQAWTTILGWNPQEVVGHHHLHFAAGNGRDRNALVLKTAMDQGQPPFETEQRHKDGSTRWISWVAAQAGGIVYASGRNITAEKQAAAALEAAQEQLRQSQKMEAVGQLTGGIAHDFNNLLTGITGSLEILQTRLAQGRLDEAARYIAAAQGAAARAASLTHRLLAFSRRQTLDPKPVDVNLLVSGMAELISRTAGASIHTGFETEPALWPTLADPNQLENALLNLCINARDAMPGGGSMTIATANATLGAHAAEALEVPPGDYIVLTVSDTGTGMTPETVKRAFDPFFTTKPIGQGTGLGLSMIYGFARQSGGGVRIESAPGHGTEMSLYLPRQHPHAEAPGAGEPALPAAPPPSTRCVLVVDDDTTIRMLTVEVLHELGLSALEAGDAAAARETLDTATRIDLLITDIGLPGTMNGRELAEYARRTRPALPVLIVTGYAENALRDGLPPKMQLLPKPFTLEALAACIKALAAA